MAKTECDEVAARVAKAIRNLGQTLTESLQTFTESLQVSYQFHRVERVLIALFLLLPDFVLFRIIGQDEGRVVISASYVSSLANYATKSLVHYAKN